MSAVTKRVTLERIELGEQPFLKRNSSVRGARYFPFVLPENTDRFCRKFDDDLENELRVLEELHYHSIHDSRYISELRTALVEQGMMDEREVTRKLKTQRPVQANRLL